MAAALRVGGAGLALLLVGQRHGAQGQELIDLGGVEEVGRALGGDASVVLEDDRRGEHDRPLPLEPGQNRPAAHVGAGRRRRPRPLRRIGERQEARRRCTASRMCVPISDERSASSRPSWMAGARDRLSTRTRRRSSGWRDLGGALDRQVDLAAHRLTPAHHPPDQAARSRPRSARRRARPRSRTARCAGRRREAPRREARSRAPPPRPRRSTSRRPSRANRRRGTARRARRASPRACAAAAAGSGPSRSAPDARPGSIRHSVCIQDSSHPPCSRQARGATTPNCQRTWFLRADARYG